MTKQEILKNTKSYEEWLISSLKNKEEAATYLQVALREYQKNNDAEAFLLALRHVAEAQGATFPVENYSLERQAEFLLSNAVDSQDYEQARKAVRELGFEPDKIQHKKLSTKK